MKYYSFIAALFFSLSSYAQLTDDLVLFYNMDNNTEDMSDNDNNGIPVNTEPTTNVNDDFESAIYFDGSAYITLPDHPSIKPELPITLSMMLKPDSFNENQGLYHSDKQDNNYAGFYVNLHNTGQIMAHIGGNNGSAAPSNRRSFLTNESLVVGEWQYLTVIISDYNDMEVYLDCREMEGAYSGSGSMDIVYTSSTGTIGFGGETLNYPNGYPFEGAIDEVALWDRALSIDEIEEVCDGILSNLSTDYAVVSESGNMNVSVSSQEIQLTLDTSLLYDNSSFELYNATGQLVRNSVIKSSDITIQRNGLVSGLYFLHIKDQHEMLMYRKLILL